MLCCRNQVTQNDFGYKKKRRLRQRENAPQIFSLPQVVKCGDWYGWKHTDNAVQAQFNQIFDNKTNTDERQLAIYNQMRE